MTNRTIDQDARVILRRSRGCAIRRSAQTLTLPACGSCTPVLRRPPARCPKRSATHTG